MRRSFIFLCFKFAYFYCYLVIYLNHCSAQTIDIDEHDSYRLETIQQKFFMENSSQTLEEKIDYFSHCFLLKPYAASPLGEGMAGKYDNDPLFDLESFDCMTYVEQILALTISKSANKFLHNLIRIRYKNGNINFGSRNHFVVSDWIENNSWLFNNITVKIGSKYVLKMYKNIDKGFFLNQSGIDTTSSITRHEIDYIPVQYSMDVEDKLKTGDIICFVTRKSQVFVNHMGFIVIKNNRIYIRHASKLYNRVIQEEFEKKIQEISSHTYNAGFLFLRLNPAFALSN